MTATPPDGTQTSLHANKPPQGPHVIARADVYKPIAHYGHGSEAHTVTTTIDPSPIHPGVAMTAEAAISPHAGVRCPRSALPTPPSTLGISTPEHHAPSISPQPQRRLPAYYLGRPAQVWIRAMSPRLAFTPTSTEAEARPAYCQTCRSVR
jgi:hypothetical protein